MEWFSFCGLFKWEVVNAAGVLQRDACLVEERIVLFRAADLDDAIRLGEAEAVSHTNHTWPNASGETVRMRYLGVSNAFALDDAPGEGVEVHSRLLLRPSAESDHSVIERFLGSESEQATNVEYFEPDFDRVADMNRKGTNG